MSDVVPKILYNELQAKLEEKNNKIGRLEEQLKNNNYYRYCNVVRNEIAKYDKYAWSSGFSYTPFQADLDYITNWEDVQEEKRKMRLIHALSNSTDDEVLKLSRRIPSDMNIETFAANIAKAYRIISEEVHKLSYSVNFSELYCAKVTSDKQINMCINLLMEDVEFNVGEMVPVPKKFKTEQQSSSQHVN